MDQQYFEEKPIKDLVVYRPRKIFDHRGFFMESFNQKHFLQRGMTNPFVQDNRSFSKQGTLRGLHLQLDESAQAKLVGVLSGRVFDVAVDVRLGSETYGKWFGITLDAQSETPEFLYVPRGFAHGFLVLSDTAEFYYKVDNFYHRDKESGIRFDDAELGIAWPQVDGDFILSDKDKDLPSFSQFTSQLKGGME